MRTKILLFIGATFCFLSCDDDLSQLNVDPKNPTEIGAEPLFTNGQYNLVNQMVNINYNHNVDRFWANYYTQTTYIEESSYDAANRDIGGSMWDNIYTETLYELKAAKDLLRAEEVSSALQAEQDNKIAIIKIHEVYAYQYLVDNFGNVPFTEALDINNITPAYDDAETIYYSIADSLQAAIAILDPTADGFRASGDLIYGGDVGQWKKFANSLLLKIGLRLADFNNSKADALVSAAVSGGVFESNEDNANFAFIETQPYTNPIYDYFFVANRASDFVVTQNFIDMLEGLSDPRIDYYVDDNLADGYIGGEYGAAGNAYEELTHPTPTITEATFPGTILDYSTVSFMLSEAVERGYISGDAAEYYEAGIRASFEFWGLSSAEADAYIAQESVNYSSAPGDYKQKIGSQKYIALYNQGHEAWTEARRLDYPVLATAASNNVPNPKRMIYPVEEVLINTKNYEAAKTAIGDDKTSSSIFWDVR
jgi:hypothetical protein